MSRAQRKIKMPIDKPELEDDNEDNLDDNSQKDDLDNNEDDQETEEQKAEREAKEALELDNKKVKASIDAAYKARDEALAKVAEVERKEREAETAKLREQGKLEEAHAREIADKDTLVATKDATIKDLEKEITRLTRDASVRDTLGSFDFRNQKARDVATGDITKMLKKDENGEWVAKDGRSIEVLVKAYLEDKENTWLLKPKNSSGSGVTKTTPDGGGKKTEGSLFGLPQSEVIARVAKGELRRG
jgi:hypothetical protein